MDHVAWRIACRLPACGWEKAGVGGFISIDDRLMEHLLGAHTPRQIAEALTGTWTRDAITNPISTISGAEVDIINQIGELKNDVAERDRRIKQLSEKLKGRRKPKPEPSPLRQGAVLLGDGGFGEE